MLLQVSMLCFKLKCVFVTEKKAEAPKEEKTPKAKGGKVASKFFNLFVFFKRFCMSFSQKLF